jgi:hypothetical protein
MPAMFRLGKKRPAVGRPFLPSISNTVPNGQTCRNDRLNDEAHRQRPIYPTENVLTHPGEQIVHCQLWCSTVERHGVSPFRRCRAVTPELHAAATKIFPSAIFTS